MKKIANFRINRYAYFGVYSFLDNEYYLKEGVIKISNNKIVCNNLIIDPYMIFNKKQDADMKISLYNFHRRHIMVDINLK